jgi:hypothetical protein
MILTLVVEIGGHPLIQGILNLLGVFRVDQAVATGERE